MTYDWINYRVYAHLCSFSILNLLNFVHISINYFIFNNPVAKLACRSKINSIKTEIFDVVNGIFDEKIAFLVKYIHFCD